RTIVEERPVQLHDGSDGVWVPGTILHLRAENSHAGLDTSDEPGTPRHPQLPDMKSLLGDGRSRVTRRIPVRHEREPELSAFDPPNELCAGAPGGAFTSKAPPLLRIERPVLEVIVDGELRMAYLAQSACESQDHHCDQSRPRH